MVWRYTLYETLKVTMLHLTFPKISHKSEYLAMIAEWKSFETTPTSPGRLFAGEGKAMKSSSLS